MSFIAKYRGTCVACDEDITPGMEVDYNDERELIHVPLCPVSLDGWGRPKAICPRCFMELPAIGVCGVCD